MIGSWFVGRNPTSVVAVVKSGWPFGRLDLVGGTLTFSLHTVLGRPATIHAKRGIIEPRSACLSQSSTALSCGVADGSQTRGSGALIPP